MPAGNSWRFSYGYWHLRCWCVRELEVHSQDIMLVGTPDTRADKQAALSNLKQVESVGKSAAPASADHRHKHMPNSEKKINRISLSMIDGLLQLNNDHAQETSWLSETQFKHLLREACYARAVVSNEAMILAFDPKAEYDSPNFIWFRERFSNFVYLDRVIVAERARRQGLAAAFYEDLFRWAAANRYDFVGCEVNQVPLNPVSDAFHEKMRFTQVGEGEPLAGKRVRYLSVPLRSERPVMVEACETVNVCERN
jgi:hypothetical protein